MRISDWSSDVCSSDLPGVDQLADGGGELVVLGAVRRRLLGQNDRPAGGEMLHDDAENRRLQHHPVLVPGLGHGNEVRSEEHTSELQSLMRISYAVFCLKKKSQKLESRHNM